MARARNANETPYQRRIRRYLEAHPGATRQEARGHRLRPGERSEYARRVKSARSKEARREASGHAGQVRAFLRDLRDGTIVNVDVDEATKGFDGKTFSVITKWTIDGADDGRMYVFRRMSLTRFRRLIREELERGAILSPAYSLNQRKVLAEVGSDE